MLYLAQENYLDMIFKLFNMTNYKPASTPMCKGTIVYKKSCPTNKIEIKNWKMYFLHRLLEVLYMQ